MDGDDPPPPDPAHRPLSDELLRVLLETLSLLDILWRVAACFFIGIGLTHDLSKYGFSPRWSILWGSNVTYLLILLNFKDFHFPRWDPPHSYGIHPPRISFTYMQADLIFPIVLEVAHRSDYMAVPVLPPITYRGYGIPDVPEPKIFELINSTAVARAPLLWYPRPVVLPGELTATSWTKHPRGPPFLLMMHTVPSHDAPSNEALAAELNATWYLGRDVGEIPSSILPLRNAPECEQAEPHTEKLDSGRTLIHRGRRLCPGRIDMKRPFLAGMIDIPNTRHGNLTMFVGRAVLEEVMNKYKHPELYQNMMEFAGQPFEG